MSVKRYNNGAWEEVGTLKRYVDGAWQDCEAAYRYVDGAWEEVWSAVKLSVYETSNGLSFQVFGTTLICEMITNAYQSGTIYIWLQDVNMTNPVVEYLASGNIELASGTTGPVGTIVAYGITTDGTTVTGASNQLLNWEEKTGNATLTGTFKTVGVRISLSTRNNDTDIDRGLIVDYVSINGKKYNIADI